MKIIAHRGASQDRPEHTLDAYELAVEQGSDGLECDIRLTADGHIVCLHDRTLKRVAGEDVSVSTMTRTDLEGLDVGTADHPASVLFLPELVELAMDSGVSLFIETKHPVRYGGAVEQYLYTLLERMKLSDCPDIHIISFSLQSLHRMGRLTPHLHRVFLRRDRHGAIDPSTWVAPAAGAGLGYGPSIKRAKRNPAAIDRAAGTYVWTVDKEKDVRWVARQDVQWLATNVPAVARTWMEDELATYQQSNPTLGMRMR